MAHNKVEVLDEFEVSPPPGSLPTTLSLPLTFFDLPWLLVEQTQNAQLLFIYAHPQSLHEFTRTTIPSLKSSLSLTLQHFYPFVSNLILPPPPQKPHVLFTEGNSVSFTVAQYSSHDFDHVISDKTKDVTVLHPFAPRSLSTRLLPDGTRVNSILAVQVTLFPNQGICIGIGSNHAVADGSTVDHFMKSWASICKSKGCVDFMMPSFDQTSIEDPYELESKILKHWRSWYSPNEILETLSNDIYKDKVRSTFVLKRSQIEKLKQYLSKNSTGSVHFSSFVVTCSFLWSCLIKSLENNDEKLCYFIFSVDCRNRFGITIPKTYFGNCIKILFPEVTRSELIAQNGVIFAAKSIKNSMKELESLGALRLINEEKLGTIFSHQTSVAGSPNFGFYKIDFGWGCPKKIEVVHIDLTNTISLVEYCRDEEGGIEIGLALKMGEMDAFTQHFEQGLMFLTTESRTRKCKL